MFSESCAYSVINVCYNKGHVHGSVPLFCLGGERGSFISRKEDDPEELGSKRSKQLSTKGKEAFRVFFLDESRGDIRQLLPHPHFGTSRRWLDKSSPQVVGLLGWSAWTSRSCNSGSESGVSIFVVVERHDVGTRTGEDERSMCAVTR
jgi:hypothetical protein